MSNIDRDQTLITKEPKLLYENTTQKPGGGNVIYGIVQNAKGEIIHSSTTITETGSRIIANLSETD